MTQLELYFYVMCNTILVVCEPFSSQLSPDSYPSRKDTTNAIEKISRKPILMFNCLYKNTFQLQIKSRTSPGNVAIVPSAPMISLLRQPCWNDSVDCYFRFRKRAQGCVISWCQLPAASLALDNAGCRWLHRSTETTQYIHANLLT